MKNSVQLSPVQEITMEVFKLLQVYWLFKRYSEKIVIEDRGGLDALEQRLLMRALYQDIILRLCKIGDVGRIHGASNKSRNT